ncbi:YncE family protein [Hymenobacter humi]|uniref:YncE family protein n=1 Tax=Hymenobacter humi TaxID=1411620 RepID=A0ABW2UDC2_9BACT
MKNLLFIAPLACLLVGGPARAQTPRVGAVVPAPYRLLRTIPIGGEGGWDFLQVDPAGTRLYISHDAQVEVVDLKTHRLIGHILNTPGAHCIEVVPAAGRGYISCGRSNTCVVFDLRTLRTIATVPTGTKPDPCSTMPSPSACLCSAATAAPAPYSMRPPAR